MYKKQLKTLLRDYGYRVDDKSIISIGIREFTSDRIINRCRDIVDAAEMLCPIIRDPEYTHRLTTIMKPQD